MEHNGIKHESGEEKHQRSDRNDGKLKELETLRGATKKMRFPSQKKMDVRVRWV